MPHCPFNAVGGAPVGKVQQHHVAGGPLDQGSDRGAAVPTDEQVALPVAGDGAIVCFWWPFADHEHVAELAGVLRASTRAPCDPSGAQAAGQLATYFAAALHEQGLIDL
jgi:hypothetical protein